MRVNDYLQIPSIAWFDTEIFATEEIFHPATREKVQGVLERYDSSKTPEDRIASINELATFYEGLFPGSSELKWFREDTPISPEGMQIITQYIIATVMGYPWIPPGRRYSHEKAEQLLNYLADEKAKKFEITRGEVLAEAEDALTKK